MTSRVDQGRLLIDGRPTLLLGGELHNSSASTALCMTTRWAGIVDAGCNTVLAPVTWEQFEPEEGRFDTTSVDALLSGARAHGLSLVLLWFGSWKNGISTYVPPWVKMDPGRFGVQHLGGRRSVVLSPFVPANWEADTTAFAALMAHLHIVDEAGTVVMVQVQNEVGSLGDTRDRSPAAETAWTALVPEALLLHLRDADDGCIVEALVKPDPAADAAGWAETFGDSDSTDELFMAWHLAAYVDRVAQAGRAEHDVPLFVNAWLNYEAEGGSSNVTGGNRPGVYPSGGPLPHVAAAWHVAAPSIDFLAPDIYAPDPDFWLRRYHSVSSAVFVPELHRSRRGLDTIFLAIGSYGAIGTAPFGIDELTDDERHRLRRAYQQLAAIADDIVDAQTAGTVAGFVVGPDRTADLELGRYRFTVVAGRRYDDLSLPPEPGYGLIVALSDDEFIVTGHGFLLLARTREDGPAIFHTVQELDLEPATGRARDLPVLRWLNGDETLSGTPGAGVRVTGDVVSAWPGGLPASGSITGLVRFSLLTAPD